MDVRSLLGRLRQPAYTGANRCLPCTAVNLVLVAIAAGVAGLVEPAAGLAVAVLGAGAVWLRGYLVPGTPALTRRYLPDRVLALFGKGPDPARIDGDPEARLAALGVLDHAGDPSLAPDFRAEWGATARRLTDDTAALRRVAGEVLSVDPGLIDVTAPEDEAGGVVMRADGDWVGQWPSRSALAADLATERLLAGERWDALERVERADLAARIRGLADRCPGCGEPTRVSEDTVTSCCRSAEVIAVTCTGCGARLAEFDPSPAAFAPGQ